MMITLLFWLALVTLLLMAAGTIEAVLGNRSLVDLSNVPPMTGETVPRVSIIIPARNEARNIATALQSVLHLDYPDYEVCVINDRSTDNTREILDTMAQQEPRLHVVHMTDLPDGWLGKNHAAYCGAQHATGDYLLFTDADVVFAPTALSRAMNYALAHQLDHLAVAPTIKMPGVLLNMFAVGFVIFFGQYAKPWKARDPKSKRHIGIGAFNLVRAEAYRAAGTHQAIALRPDDDMKLGKLLKKAGFRQDILIGGNLLTVEWYGSVGELVRGLEKNSFAGLEYRFSLLVAATAGQVVFLLWPYLGVFVTQGATQLLNAGIVALISLISWHSARANHLKPWAWLGFPLAAVMFLFIIWRATVLTLVRGGIQWRDTHYPLAALKANQV